MTQQQLFIQEQIDEARRILDIWERAIKTNAVNVMQERSISTILSKFNGQR